jgi:hypothetical protein
MVCNSSESDELNRQEPVSNLKIILTPPITYSTIHFHSFIHTMLTAISKVGSSSVPLLRTCARCLRSSRSKTYKAVKGLHLGRTFSTATSTATGTTISRDDPPSAYSASAEAGPSRDRMRNVWSLSFHLLRFG